MVKADMAGGTNAVSDAVETIARNAWLSDRFIHTETLMTLSSSLMARRS